MDLDFIMPNTLSHIAVQSLFFGRFVSESSIKWVVLGALLSDIPWIVRKLLGAMPDFSDPYTVRLYAIVQASFLFCLVLCVAVSVFSKRFLPTFILLSASCLMHLILDATELKYSAGIHLFVPFSWYSFDLPILKTDGVAALILTFIGGAVAFFLSVHVVLRHRKLSSGSRLMNLDLSTVRASVGLIALLVYFLLPIALIDQAISANVGSIGTLMERENRTGKTVKFDREWLKVQDGEVFMSTFANEDLAVENLSPDQKYNGRKVSGIVEFVTSESVNFKVIHVYENYWRDWASYPGLLFIIFYFYVERRIR